MSDRDLTGIKILLVDDEEMICQMLADNFEMEGAICLQAQNGERALQIFSSEKDIDIVLTDIQMPKLNGKELTEAIRQSNADIPILCMSGYSSYDEKDVLSWGANAFITKPADMDLVFSTVHSLISIS